MRRWVGLFSEISVAFRANETVRKIIFCGELDSLVAHYHGIDGLCDDLDWGRDPSNR